MKALLPPEGQETTLWEAEGEQKREGCSQSFRALDTDFSAGKLRVSWEARETHLWREDIGFGEVNRKDCGWGPRAYKGSVAHYPDQIRENLSQGLISILKTETIIETFLNKQYPLEHLSNKWLATVNTRPCLTKAPVALERVPPIPFHIGGLDTFFVCLLVLRSCGLNSGLCTC